MYRRQRRFCTTVTALAALCCLASIAAGCGSSDAPTTLNATIDVVNAKPKGGVQDLKVKKDGQVHLTINSDTADEIHVHATDQHADVKKGGTVKMTIKPAGTGNSEIELEAHKEQIGELTIVP